MEIKKKKLAVGMIIRNEANQYLKEVLDSIQDYASEEVELTVIVVDDASGDNSPEICESYPKTRVVRLKERLFDKDESKLRNILWEEIRKERADWILIQDADEIFEKRFSEMLPSFLKSPYQWISFKWCDMWTDTHYRIDKLWSPCFRRLFRFRNQPFGIAPLKIHCSNIPYYATESNFGICYADIRVKHLARIKDEDKKDKAEWYLTHGTDLTDREHMASVFDPNPTLKEFKEPIEFPNVMIAGLIRNRAWCLKDFLDGLGMQDYPKDKISFFWVVGDCTDSTIPQLEAWAKKKRNEYRKITLFEWNWGRSDDKEHVWPDELLIRMGLMRNKYLEEIGDNEFVFSIDSDVILKEKGILKHLVCLDREIVAEVCWATWGKINDFPLPTVWRFGGYGGTDENFLALMRKKGTYKVGGVCTCELISKSAIEKEVNFSRILNLPPEMNGEDRQLSVRAAVANVDLWADTYFRAQHLEKETFLLKEEMKKVRKKRKPDHQISLCMLTGNEEEFLDEFLLKMAPLFDEIIIVDTGSKDSTLEVARKYTKKIFHFDWCDDFAKARNFLIGKATCPWIFYADPDESYRLNDLKQFEKMVKTGDAVGFVFLVFNYRGDRSQPSLSESVRLFRNLPEIKFTGLVHETLDESLAKYTKEHPETTMQMSPIPMYHWGFVKGARDRVEKLSYYRELNKKQLEKNPDDCRPYYNLAMHLLEENERKEEGIRLLQKSIELSKTFYQPRRELGLYHLREARTQFAESLKLLPPAHPFHNFQKRGVQWINNFLGEGLIPRQVKIQPGARVR